MTVDHTDPEETYLTVAEVAQTLKLNQQTVRNWIDQGALPALRVGRRVRIKRSDFERILDESYSGGRASSTAAAGPSADDFWGGEPVGLAEPSNSGPDGAGPEPGEDSDPSAPNTPVPSNPASSTPAA
jgi:excisionase family DNA binding protein